MAGGHAWKPSSLSAGVATGLVAAGIIAGGTWIVSQAIADGDERQLVGGCAAFNLFAQNQFDPVGTKIRSDPSPTSATGESFAPNEVITVDGWVRTRAPYPTNTPPWNSDVWFHLASDDGWVAYAAVRAVPTAPGPEGNFEDGSDPAPVDEGCSGSIRT